MSSSGSAITPMSAPTGALPPGRHQDLAQDAGAERLHLHVGLVGLDLGQHVADLDRVAFVLAPLDDGALLHGGGELGEHDLGDAHRDPVAPGWWTDGVGGPAVQDLVHRVHHLLGLGQVGLLERLRVGHGHVGRGHAHHRSVEVVEALALHAVGDLGPEARVAPALLDHHAAVGLAHRVEDQVLVEGAQGARDRPPRPRCLPWPAGRRRARAVMHGAAPGHDGHVLARALHVGEAEGDVVLLVRAPRP